MVEVFVILDCQKFIGVIFFSASGFIPFVRAEILDTELEYSIHVSFSIDLDLGLDSSSRAGICFPL